MTYSNESRGVSYESELRIECVVMSQRLKIVMHSNESELDDIEQ